MTYYPLQFLVSLGEGNLDKIQKNSSFFFGTSSLVGIIFVNICIIGQGVNCGVGDDDFNIMMVLLKKRAISTLKTRRARHNSDN